MLVVTATEVKNQLGDLFDAVEKSGGASVLIERNRRPVAMLLNVQLAEKAILCAYVQGVSDTARARRYGISMLPTRCPRLRLSRPTAANSPSSATSQS